MEGGGLMYFQMFSGRGGEGEAGGGVAVHDEMGCF